jgi:hypothetical protein
MQGEVRGAGEGGQPAKEVGIGSNGCRRAFAYPGYGWCVIRGAKGARLRCGCYVLEHSGAEDQACQLQVAISYRACWIGAGNEVLLYVLIE